MKKILSHKIKNSAQLLAKIRHVQDFPTPGIKFYDITPLLQDRKAFRQAVEALASFFQKENVDKVVGIDARGFLLAAPVAYVLGVGLVIVRKKGKLPYDVIIQYHALEYGKARLEIHTDAIKKGERVVVIDDVLATGGTAGAGIKLVEKLGGRVVGVGFLLELKGLGGREKLGEYNVQSLLTI